MNASNGVQQQACGAEEQQKQGQTSRCSTPSSSSSSSLSVPVETILDHVSCQLCEGPVASSLLLSCSHLFCGACLFIKLQQKACCPTCSMDLRAIPIRCLAMDRVAASIVPSLSEEEQKEYSKRKRDGQCVADQVNKMFHHLAPPPMHNASALLHRAGAVVAPIEPIGFRSLGQMVCAGSTLHPVGRRNSHPGGPPNHSLHQQQKQQQYLNPMALHFGSFPGPAAVAAPGPNLLQIAAAQQLAQMQQLQQHLSAINMNPAASGVSAQYPCRHTALDSLALKQPLLGREHSSMFGPGSPPAVSAAVGYQEMHLKSIMDSMCQV